MDLDTHFKTLLNENVGYGYSLGGNMPVDAVDFPTTGPCPSEKPQVDPTRPLITTGETTPAGTGRQDYRMEVTSEDECIEEVGNLLITIGHILNQSGLISDKYQVGEIMDYLNQNFIYDEVPQDTNAQIDQMTCPASQDDNIPTSCPDDGSTPLPQQIPQQIPQGYSYLQEMKKYEEKLVMITESHKD